MYYFENYQVERFSNFFKVTDIISEVTVRIRKSAVEIKSDEDKEMLAILLARIEFERFYDEPYVRKKSVKFIESVKFKDELEKLLQEKDVETLLSEISDMKFYEIQNFFCNSRDSKRIDYEYEDPDNYD